MNEFNLSEKMKCMYGEDLYLSKDIKEFIRRLKEEISSIRKHDRKSQTPIVLNLIDKLAGGDLDGT